MSRDDAMSYMRLDYLREVLAPLLRQEGLLYLHCPDWTGCGQFTIQAEDEPHWVCPVHGDAGVEP